jgi:hypothetical protein
VKIFNAVILYPPVFLLLFILFLHAVIHLCLEEAAVPLDLAVQTRFGTWEPAKINWIIHACKVLSWVLANY